MRKQFNHSNISEIRTLLSVALACLDAGEMDRLAWRLADAAGILREELAGKYEGGLCGLDEPTGRGYVLPAKSPEQKQYTQREVFNATRENEVPLCVMNIAGSAADNAAATINENGGQFVQGNFTDEFVSIWYLTVIGLLSEGDCEPEASEWFASIGVRA